MNRYEGIYYLVNTDTELMTLGVQNVYRGNAPDNPPEDIFIVLRWESNTKALPEYVGTQTLTIWVYQPPGSYVIIDQIIERLKTILGTVGNDGFALCEWNTDSGDLYDDMWVKCTRNSTYTVV